MFKGTFINLINHCNAMDGEKKKHYSINNNNYLKGSVTTVKKHIHR